MEAVANIKYLRTSSKKIKRLAQLVVGSMPQEAMDRLFMAGTKGAKLLAKAIKSAQATATNNLKLDASRLRVKTIEVLKGPTLKRWQPVSRGRIHQIKKKRTHIRVVLEEVKSYGKKS